MIPLELQEFMLKEFENAEYDDYESFELKLTDYIELLEQQRKGNNRPVCSAVKNE